MSNDFADSGTSDESALSSSDELDIFADCVIFNVFAEYDTCDVSASPGSDESGTSNEFVDSDEFNDSDIFDMSALLAFDALDIFDVFESSDDDST